MKVNHRGIGFGLGAGARPAPRSGPRPSSPSTPAVGFPWNALAAQVKSKAMNVLGAWLTDDEGDSDKSTLVIRIRGPRLTMRAIANALSRPGQ